jgi:hypothetical protein
MDESNRLLSYDWLLATGAEPQWFGLGFVQLKLNDEERLHFWPGPGQAIVSDEELHDHRYTFQSDILKGELTHSIFAFDPLTYSDRKYGVEGTHMMTKVSCDPSKPPPLELGVRGHIREVGFQVLPAGSSYTFMRGNFHRTFIHKPTVTYLCRDEERVEFARVIRPIGAPAVCPFSEPKSSEECWDIIKTILNEDAPKPGYHMTTIEKGVLGEASKIKEEVEEFMDAVEQDVSIMALVELSDLVGAVESYLAKHHPSMNFDDLRSMSEVTKRAFQNGRRG